MPIKRWLALLLVSLLSGGCSLFPQTPPQPTVEDPLVIYGWAGYIPQSILDAFEQEFGIPVRYDTYDNQGIAVEQMQAGKQVDVAVLGDSYILPAVADGLLAELNLSNIANFRNLGANFRDLAYDPGNRYSIMLQWGTTGLIVRTDRVQQPVTGWADLWNPDYAGKIGVWPFSDELVGISLKSLGHSLNSEEPEQLTAAEERMLQLSKNVYLLDPSLVTGASHLLDDETVMIYGWSYDAMLAQEASDAVAYVLPKEGTILWTDNLTIAAGSRHVQAAEQFINFLLRPDISAQMVNELWIASPNEAARPAIKQEILNNPLVYPISIDLQKAEYYAVISEEAQQQHDLIWERFMADYEANVGD